MKELIVPEVAPEDYGLTTLGFVEGALGLGLYDWQAEALLPLELATGANARRVNISICTPNGAGKDDRIIPGATYWWLALHKRGRVVITSKSDLQMSQQTIPSLNKHWMKFGYPEPVKSPRYELRTTTGGSLVAFVTNEASRVEGFHKEDDIDGPLLYIVNEAKSVDESMFEGIDRCTVNCLMYVSSPGAKMGRFFDTHTKLRDSWYCTQVGLKDCPHIDQDKIDHVITTFGEDHPMTRSILYGEFMSQPEGEYYCCTIEHVMACIDSPPQHEKNGFRFAFCDFADGGAENVVVLRDGNKYTIEDAWREQNEDAVVGKFIYHFKRLGLEPDQIGGDAAAKGILDKLAQAGWPIYRQNFGAPDKSGIYKSWSAMAWIEGSNKIKNREVLLPDDDVLIRQLTTRKKEFTLTGKIGVEEKYVLQKRGIKSPDRADAFFGAMAALDLRQMFGKSVFDVSNWRDGGRESDSEMAAAFGAGGCL